MNATLRIVAGLLLATGNGSAISQYQAPLIVSTEVQQQLGIQQLVLTGHRAQARVDAVLRVLDPGPLAAVDAEIRTATGALQASGREAARLKRLADDDQIASRAALESAQSLAAADAARLSLAQRRIALEWSAAPVLADGAARAALLDDVIAARKLLVRIDSTEPLPTQTLSFTFGQDTPAMVANVLGRAALADPRMQTAGLLAILTDVAETLRPGMMIGVSVASDNEIEGVVLPRSALIRYQGTTWAYAREAEDRFARRAVTLVEPLPEGWFVTAEFAPGDTVVSSGAGDLLALERSGDDAGAED
jgi:hypothetical protein